MNLSLKKSKVATDPVCGVYVTPTLNDIIAEIEGETYYFCAESCRKSFVQNPQKFLCKSARKKGIWGRYLARLEKASGGKAMKCH
jgi:YHS domain-containing protein